MLVPTKHEILERNILVVGAKVIEKIKKEDLLVEELVEIVLNEVPDCTVDIVFDSLTFLYCVEAIEINNYHVRVKK